MSVRLAFATAVSPSGFGPILYAGDIETAARTAAELGLDGLELHLRCPEELDDVDLHRLLDDHGLVLAGIASGRIFSDDGLSLSDPDPARRREATRRVNELLDVAADFGATLLVGLLRGVRLVDDDRERTLSMLIETLQSCADHAAVGGTQIVLEAINRYETRLLPTAAETVAAIEQVDRDNVGVLLDTFHMNIEEVSQTEAIRQTGPRLRHFHASDSNRRAPGMGHIDFGAAAAALREVDYSGWVSAEILPLPDDRVAAECAARTMREHFGGGNDTDA